MLFEVYRLFNGKTTTCHGHSVRNLSGFMKAIKGYQTGNGHGFMVVIPAAYAKRLGLTEFNGLLHAPGLGAVCYGEIQKA